MQTFSSSHRRLTAMIVDDNPGDVHLIKEALKKPDLDLTAIVFEDGESAFRYIDGSGGAQVNVVPDVVILDLNVPKRSGSEVLVCIRRNPQWRHVPVVILSSSPRHVMLDTAAQADRYVPKPAELDDFLRIGDEILDCVAIAQLGAST